MRENRVLSNHKLNRPSYGIFAELQSTSSIENMALSGLDFVIIDAEHAPLGTEFINRAIIAADAAGITPFVRIPEISRREVLHALDGGAQGLVIPSVETVDEVRHLVHWAKFAPVGSRGYVPTRDGLWGDDESYAGGGVSYMEEANRHTLLLPQCETMGCLENLEEIVSMDGVDGIFVGPLDLSIALGCPMQMDSPRETEAIEHILKTVHQYNKLAFIYSGDTETALRMTKMGYDAVNIGTDVFVLRAGLQAISKNLNRA